MIEIDYEDEQEHEPDWIVLKVRSRERLSELTNHLAINRKWFKVEWDYGQDLYRVTTLYTIRFGDVEMNRIFEVAVL